MDEPSLHDLLERATVPEPPIGPIAQNALHAGLTLRRRRRGNYAAGAAAAIIVACAVVLAATGVAGGRAEAPGGGGGTVYVLNETNGQAFVTPISAATGTPGEPIVVATGTEGMPGDGMGNVPGQGGLMTITQDQKTIWVADGNDAVTPISTATNTAGNPVTVTHTSGADTEQVLVTPDGKTVYVLDSTGTVTPISTATDRVGTPISVAPSGDGLPQGGMVITPDGHTLYVLQTRLLKTVQQNPFRVVDVPSYLVPIDTATNTPGAPIQLEPHAASILVAPDGKTVYVIGSGTGSAPALQVTPISTTTNKPGKSVTIEVGQYGNANPVMTPDGHAIYLSVGSADGTVGIVPFSTVTDKAGKMISLGSAEIMGVVISPDGRTAYVLSQPMPNPGSTPNDLPISSSPPSPSGNGGAIPFIPIPSAIARCPGGIGSVTPVSTSTGAAGAPINVHCVPNTIAISPDGRTVWVAVPGSVVPIAAATGRLGQPVKIDEPTPAAIVITP